MQSFSATFIDSFNTENESVWLVAIENFEAGIST
jgi:hypothetical protein